MLNKNFIDQKLLKSFILFQNIHQVNLLNANFA